MSSDAEISRQTAESRLAEALTGYNSDELLADKKEVVMQAYRILHAQLRAEEGDKLIYQIEKDMCRENAPYIQIVLQTSGGKRVPVLSLVGPRWAHFWPSIDDLLLYDLPKKKD